MAVLSFALPASPRRYVASAADSAWWLLLSVLALVWAAMRWSWSKIVLVALGSVGSDAFKGVLQTGDWSGLDPRAWTLTQVFLRYPAGSTLALGAAVTLALVSWRADLAVKARAKQRAARPALQAGYAVTPVGKLQANDYMPKYVAGAYQQRSDANRRDLDIITRSALSEASKPGATLRGVCIFGPPMQGKTRCAWEALHEQLDGWTFVRWPRKELGAPAFNDESIAGQRVVLWLDDLQDYATPADAATVQALPTRFARAKRVVVVATCREGADERRAREAFTGLLAQLREVRLRDISDPQAHALAESVRRRAPGLEVYYPHDFNGTPGSVLLGVSYLRGSVYPELSENAKRVLRAMKLLRSAQITTFPEARVRATAEDLFQLDPDEQAWIEARGALCDRGFIRLLEASAAGAYELQPVASIYVDPDSGEQNQSAVPDFPQPAGTESSYWPHLRESLARRKDAQGLLSLANACKEREQGPLLSYRREAEACARAALALSPREQAAEAWGDAQNALGDVLIAEAELTDAPNERERLLDQAGAALEAALEVRQPGGFDWAETQYNLGHARYREADNTNGPQKRTRFDDSVAAFRRALEVRRREVDQKLWAYTETGLANALLGRAEVAEGAARDQLLRDSVAAYSAALTVRTREAEPGKWALVQMNLSVALAAQAEGAQGETRTRLWDQVIAACRGALEVYGQRPELTPDSYAWAQEGLGRALAQAAAEASAEKRPLLLSEAEQALRAALAVREREETAGSRQPTAQDRLNLAEALLARAEDAAPEARASLAGEATKLLQAASEFYSAPEYAEAQRMIAADLARASELASAIPMGKPAP